MQEKNLDFQPGMKVSLNGEIGIILDDFSEWHREAISDSTQTYSNSKKCYGYIKWENGDIEDWCGLFGSFKQSGGIIINDYKFQNEERFTSALNKYE